LSHQSIVDKLEQFSWQQEKLSDTLVILHLVEAQCRPDYNTVKVTKLDHAQSEPEATPEQPARPEHNTTVMKVLQTLGPQTNSAAVDFLHVLKRLERDDQAVQDWLSPNWSEKEVCPLKHHTQIVVRVKMIIVELRKMKWDSTLRDKSAFTAVARAEGRQADGGETRTRPTHGWQIVVPSFALLYLNSPGRRY
jgi:hypothetical protein